MTFDHAPRTAFCWWCRRAIVLADGDARRVVTAEGEEWICSICWEWDSPPVPVDYTTWTEGEKREAFGR